MVIKSGILEVHSHVKHKTSEWLCLFVGTGCTSELSDLTIRTHTSVVCSTQFTLFLSDSIL